MKGPEISRRDMLRGSAATVAAGLISTEAEAAPKPLNEKQKELVDTIVSEALQKTDHAGRVLFSVTMGGALENNFRGYVILQRAGRQYAKFHTQREVMNERNKRIIRSEAFVKEILRSFRQAGLINDADVANAGDGSVFARIEYRDHAEYNEGKAITFKYGMHIGDKIFGDEDVLNVGN